MEIGVEGAPFRFLPDFVAFLPQMRQKPGIIPGMAELDAVQVGGLVKVHKFIVRLNPRLICQGRHNPLDGAGNPGGAKVPQDADPLVALLNVEIPQIFVAQNGVGDARLSQVGSTEVDPLGGKLGFAVQQRAEGGGKGRDASGGFGADDPLRGNFHQPHVHHGIRIVFRQNIVQHGRVGRAPLHHKLPVFPLALFQRQVIFI